MQKKISYGILIELDFNAIEEINRALNINGFKTQTISENLLEIENIMKESGFKKMNDNLYIGKDSNPVFCVLTVQKIQKKLPLIFSGSGNTIKKLEMLRITDIEDLKLALSLN